MTANAARNAKLLFVLSNDYGELSNALYLLKGQEFQAMLLMPPRLFAINQSTLTVPSHPYASPADVLTTVRQENPDIVFLFSGYLYGINNLLGDLDSVGRLIQDLRSAPHRTVTSDPFLGLLSRLGPATFSENHPGKHWLMDHFGKVIRMLEGVTHLYLVPPKEFAGPGSVSFFNANLIEDGAGLATWQSKAVRELHVSATRKRWLFVLSFEDYVKQVLKDYVKQVQEGQLTRAPFDAILLRKLQEAVSAGKQPVLVAPKECIESLSRIGPVPEDTLVLHFCGYEKFQAFLFDAEYVFYWNVFSNSIMARVVNRLPVFFFDEGHLAYAIPALSKVGVRHYYVGATLPFLDQYRGLADEELTSLAALQQRDLEPARAQFQSSQHPIEMVQRLLVPSETQGGL